MLARAEAADQEPLPKGLSIPKELPRREERLAAIRQAKAQIEARAAERDAQEQADFDAKMKAREEKSHAHGKETWRQAAGAAQSRSAPNRSDQPHRCRFAHHARHRQGLRAELQRAGRGRYREHAGGGDRHRAGGHRQAAGRADARSACGLPDELGRVKRLLADNGYFSAANVEPVRRRRSSRCSPQGAMAITRRSIDSPSRHRCRPNRRRWRP